MVDKNNDLVILGGGPAGYSAALYAARADIDTLVLEGNLPGGRISLTDIVENYSGVTGGISGFDLSQIMRDQASSAGAKLAMENADKLTIQNDGLGFSILTDAGNEIKSQSVIIATGTTDKKIEVPGEIEFTGRGVSYCATCDGPLFRGRSVAVVGGGDSAVKEALFLSKICSKVTIIHRRDALRAEKVIQKKAFERENISFEWDTVVTEIKGDKKVQHLALKNVKTLIEKEIPIDGVFVLVGSVPNTSLFKELGILDNRGYLLTDDEMKTSVSGLFGAGDVRKKTVRQVATAVGDGAIAAISAQEFLENSV
ncbi:thioredoxin-disulfide reductase [candidate division WOR-3 bacterium]|nr:thioredoxin-disulfide reductase [candidate division WOR-3 bacterium]